MIKRGEGIEVLPEFRDEGGEDFEWIAASNEEKGRIDISPTSTGLVLAPIQTVKVEWVRKI